MPKTCPMLGYPSQTEAALALSERGLKDTEIALQFGDGFTPRDIRSMLAHAKRRKGEKPTGHGRVAIVPFQTFKALQVDAHKRGITVTQLVVEMVDRIAKDGLVDAVMDDVRDPPRKSVERPQQVSA